MYRLHVFRSKHNVLLVSIHFKNSFKQGLESTLFILVQPFCLMVSTGQVHHSFVAKGHRKCCVCTEANSKY